MKVKHLVERLRNTSNCTVTIKTALTDEGTPYRECDAATDEFMVRTFEVKDNELTIYCKAKD